TEIATVYPNHASDGISGLTVTTVYSCSVPIYNAITVSAYSAEKNATTFSNIPTPPSGLTITSILSNTAILAWTDNSGNESGFKRSEERRVGKECRQRRTPEEYKKNYKEKNTAN